MTGAIQFRIDKRDGGSRVDDFCASRFGNLSRMRIGNLIEAGACLVNGSPGRAGHRLAEGDLVEVAFEEGAPTAMFPEPIPLEIVYEDEQILVVIKPAGMLVHPTIGVKTGTLANALAYHLNRLRMEDSNRLAYPGSSIVNPQALVRPGLVHRLDRATSGLMVVARTPRALTTLSRHFRRRLVEKQYLAFVWGRVQQDSGTIDAPIGRDPDARPHWRVMEGGKLAETRFKVVERQRSTTLLELQPVTGRTNQLRIHCAHIGHPIVGDELYGELPVAEGGSRLCLHAARLAFHHPATGVWMEFESELPGDMVAAVAGKVSRE